MLQHKINTQNTKARCGRLLRSYGTIRLGEGRWGYWTTCGYCCQ